MLIRYRSGGFQMLGVFEEHELSMMPADDRLPLVFLRERRRELVLALKGTRGRFSREQIEEIAAIQLTIRAIETVITE